MKTRYLAILGRQPELGLVELESLYGKAVEPFGAQTALLSQPLQVDRLGGTIKVGEVLWEGDKQPLDALPLETQTLPRRDSKTSFGISVYGGRYATKDVLRAGLTLKKALKDGGSVRFVAPTKGTMLDAAQVSHNKLIEDGFELIIVIHNDHMVIARTTGIQNIAWYSKRDYDRPARSAKVGMLPPKLAQILINTTKAPSVYDPFCGTGVVLQEALLLGRAAGGSDLAPDMVTATRTNLAWLSAEASTAAPLVVDQADARTVKLPAGTRAIVSEGYLGPNLSSKPSTADISRMRKQLEALYSSALANFFDQLPSGGEVAITTPTWHQGRERLDLVDQIKKIGYDCKDFALVDSTKLIYRRPDQQVGRQLLLLRKP